MNTPILFYYRLIAALMTLGLSLTGCERESSRTFQKDAEPTSEQTGAPQFNPEGEHSLVGIFVDGRFRCSAAIESEECPLTNKEGSVCDNW
jgi:hypothetical protein